MDKKYYILHLSSYEGEHSSLYCEAEGKEEMYCVLVVSEKSSEIVDYGYSSREQLLEAWNDVIFENI